MAQAITLRLPPNLILKLDRRAARLRISRIEHITSILQASLDRGRPIIVVADPSGPPAD